MAFLHGTYGEHSPYAGKKLINSVGTIPVYIGTAPVNQNNTENADSFKYDAYINKPIVLNSFTDAAAKIGKSSDFKTFTLMEAVYAHFMNGVKPIAPIIVVNMANPNNREEKDVRELMV